MALPDEISADLAELEIEMSSDGITPNTFTHNGGEYPCAPGSVTRKKTLGSGGYELDADLILFVRSIHFPDPADHDARPETEERITYQSRRYKIMDVVSPVGEPFLKLICIAAEKGL